jgi:N-acyl-phosphatidylethanolamine-hydrolysing phospholipase D
MKDFYYLANGAGASFPDYLKMRLKEGGFPTVDKADIASVIGKADMKLIHSSASFDSPLATWVGHATMLVQFRGINFLTDPHLTQRPGPFFFPKRLTPPALRYRELPAIDFILISHNHYDHLDRLTVDMFGNSVLWYVPLGLKSWFLNRNIRSDRVIEMDWWQSHEFGSDVKITFVPSIHWSKRSPWDAYKSLWGAWSIHWGSFQLTHEPFLEPPILLAQARESAGLPHEYFAPLKIGETFVLKKDC